MESIAGGRPVQLGRRTSGGTLPPTVLLAWELGANLGHAVRLGRLARGLAARGVRVVAAVQRPDRFQPYAVGVAEIWQAPVWPGLLGARWQRSEEAVTYDEILAELGFADPQVVTALLSSWDR